MFNDAHETPYNPHSRRPAVAVTTGRIRHRVVAAVLVVLLVGVVAARGMPVAGTVSAAWAAPSSEGAIVSAQETTETGTETTETGTTGQSSSGSPGSWWAFGLALLGLAAGIAGIFFWDLFKTNRRQDKALQYLKQNPQLLSESDRARVLDKLTTGTEGLTRGLLGFSLIGLFAIALLYLLIRNPQISNSDVVQNAMAALITLVTAVVAFYFGTRSAQTSVQSLPPLAPGETVEEEPPPDEEGPPPPPDEEAEEFPASIPDNPDEAADEFAAVPDNPDEAADEFAAVPDNPDEAADEFAAVPDNPDEEASGST